MIKLLKLIIIIIIMIILLINNITRPNLYVFVQIQYRNLISRANGSSNRKYLIIIIQANNRSINITIKILIR